MFLRGFKQTSFFGAIIGLFIFLSAQSILASTISGIVFDKQRNPIINVDVELLDDYYRLKNRTKTDGSGRYQFDGLSDGRYTVKVLPFQYDLLDQSLPTEINTMTTHGVGNGNAFINLDFYLQPKKGGLADSELSVIFSQEIPPDAKKRYDKGIELLSNNKAKDGIMELNEAVKIFPTYYQALMRIGKELMILKKHEDAVPFFFKAAEVNQKSASAYYFLGTCLHHLGKEYNKSALAALNQAFVLAPASAGVLYTLGKVERSEGKLAEAEKHLLQAKSLSKTPIPEVHKELAQLYGNDLKKFKEAADELELYLKASKLNDNEEKQTKKIINDLRAKAGSSSK